MAVRMFQRANLAFGESEARSELARLLVAEGQLDEAIAEHRLAIEKLAADQNDPRVEAKLRHDYSTTLRLAGDISTASDVSRRALELARQVRLPYLVATTQAGLGACLAESDPAEAARLWTPARDTFAELAAPERLEVEQQLAALEAAHPSLVEV
jgi:tetratricopeptide (TPR) repeat protein